MRLTDLEPQFLAVSAPGHWRHVDTLAEAQGILFLCPKCFAENGGPVGTHAVVCWSADRGTPTEERPLPGRWALKGTGYADLTLDGEGGKSRSVLLTGPGCGWHGFVTNGEIS